MATTPRGLSVRSYFDAEAEVLYQKFRMIEKLLPSATTAGASHKAEEESFGIVSIVLGKAGKSRLG